MRAQDISQRGQWQIEIIAVQRDGPNSKWTATAVVYDIRNDKPGLAGRDDNLGQFDSMAEALHEGREIMYGLLERGERPFLY